MKEIIMKKLVMILGMASLFASGSVLANSDHDVVFDDADAGVTTAAAPAAAQPGVTAGTLTINGNVWANTCYIKAGDVKKIVDLEDIYSNSLKTAGATGNPKNFTITLENCPIKGQQGEANVKLGFKKNANVDPATGNLKDIGTAPNVAKNVQFQVLHNGAVVNFNQADVKKALASKSANDEVAFDFTAQYYATGVAEPGNLTATIPFSIEYE